MTPVRKSEQGYIDTSTLIENKNQFNLFRGQLPSWDTKFHYTPKMAHSCSTAWFMTVQFTGI